MAEDQPKKKIIWMACRGTTGCPGNQAEVVFCHVAQPLTPEGGFNPQAGGRSIRYRCLTCGQPFHVTF